MDYMPWQALVFQSIPEGIILVSLGLGLMGVLPPFRKVVVIGTVISLLSFFLRRLPVIFGVHTLLYILLLALLLKIGLRDMEWWRSIAAGLLPTIILGLVEGVSTPLMLRLTGMDLTRVLHDPWLRVFFPLPNEILLGVLAYLIWRYRLSLLSGKGEVSSREEQ
ncbi:MAG: hypothetical protein ACPLQP_02980 [Moorellaceae bacterium]